jgi:phage N-6-adenine-methyltransferase
VREVRRDPRGADESAREGAGGMKREDAEEFTQSLGQIVGGSWRQIALAERLGVPEALGLSTDVWVRERLGGYMRLSVSERREAARELADDGMSQREIGRVLGVGQRTIGRDLDEPNGSVEVPESRWPQSMLIAPEPNGSALGLTETPYLARGASDVEWYTPAEYVEAARAVLGSIDLDPASSDEAQKTVQAARYFTVAEDGLAHDWFGTVWLNPPYSQPAIAEFVSKLIAAYQRGDVTAAILLTNSSTDTAWFHEAAEAAAAICFTRGRVKFIGPGGAGEEGGEVAPVGDTARPIWSVFGFRYQW